MIKPPPLPPPCPDYQLNKIEDRLVKILRAGLAQAGLDPGRRRYTTLWVPGDRHIGIWIASYATDSRWWRISHGIMGHGPWPPMYDYQELTLHLDEFTEQIGVDLARLIREPDRKWPLFAHDPRFPKYAWTELAHSTYREYWKLLEAHKEWRKHRDEEWKRKMEGRNAR